MAEALTEYSRGLWTAREAEADGLWEARRDSLVKAHRDKLLAPIAAKLLNVSTVLTIKVSRYNEDCLTPYGLAKASWAQLRGTHDQQYTVSGAPPAEALKGKRVLLLDDALASGGTLRAAYRYCEACGAAEVHGVALKVIGKYWEPPVGKGKEKEKEKRGGVLATKLRIPIFTPWGTF